MPDREAVIRLAVEVRSYIEEVYGGPPNGRCIHTSKLVTKILRENIGGRWRTMQGNFYSAQAVPRENWHCWSSDGRLVVDLTADQFGDFPPVVVVGVADLHYSVAGGYGEDDELPDHYQGWVRRRLTETQTAA